MNKGQNEKQQRLEYTQSLKREKSNSKKSVKKLLLSLGISLLFFLVTFGLIFSINSAKN